VETFPKDTKMWGHVYGSLKAFKLSQL
jgi:hypothetical protein